MMSGAVFGFILARLFRIPLVTTVHNSFDRHSVLMDLADTVVAVSQAEKEALLRRGFAPQGLEVVLNGPNDSPRMEHLDCNTGPAVLERPCVTTVCGLHKRKGVSDLIEAFALAADRYPDWRLYIVGDGPDAEELKSLAQRRCADRVSFLGSVSDPASLLRQSDVFVLASYADPCSLAVAEARFAGCAVVATAVGGTPELLGFGEHGLLVEPGNSPEIAQKLRSLMDDGEELRTWRERARRGADYLVVERVSNDYLRVYERALQSRPIGMIRKAAAVGYLAMRSVWSR
jgi:glycosyltransferase involved in cell wall biosynthesis